MWRVESLPTLRNGTPSRFNVYESGCRTRFVQTQEADLAHRIAELLNADDVRRAAI